MSVFFRFSQAQIEMAFDVGAEIECVLTHQTFCLFCITSFKRFNNMAVVNDGTKCPIVFTDGAGANRPDFRHFSLAQGGSQSGTDRLPVAATPRYFAT